MNVIRSISDSNSCHDEVRTSGVVSTGDLRTRTVSSGRSGSLGTHGVIDEEMAVIAAPPEVGMFSSTAEEMAPAEIPPEPSGTEYADDDDDLELNDNDHHRDGDNSRLGDNNNHDDDNDDDESEYEYEEDYDAAFSGFLMTDQPLQLTTNPVSQRAAEPARIREEDDDDDEFKAAEVASPMEQEPRNVNQTKQQSPSSEETTADTSRKSKWREPSRDAVNMSLRAERETTGGKRRLAQDLYRIMNQDTEEAGFSLQPKSEDAMDKWTIKLFQFDEDSHLAKDMMVLGLDHLELEMCFPEHYPFEPPFVRVVRPRFKRQTGFVMNGALCMELLTKDGWNPVNDIESVIVSIRSLLVVGEGRLQVAYDMPKQKYEQLLATAKKAAALDDDDAAKDASRKRQRSESGEQLLSRGKNNDGDDTSNKKSGKETTKGSSSSSTEPAGAYSMAEAMTAYTHLSDYHAKKGWDTSGWWTRKG